MDIKTAITTAARRIARDINATVPEVTAAYDAEGNPMETWSTGMSFANPADHPDSKLVLAGRRQTPIAQRDVQDLLDAADYADTQGAADAIDRQVETGYYLENLAQARAAR